MTEADVELPFNLSEWIEHNRHELRPPVSNKQIWLDDDLIVTVIGGGNERTDYHDDPLPEFFYQLEGTMVLRIIDQEGHPPYDVPINAGEVFLLPPHVRHSPQRLDPTGLGLVVEVGRPEGVVDGFVWYCESCWHLIHRAEVQLRSIVDDLPPLFDAFYESADARTCPACGVVHPGRPV